MIPARYSSVRLPGKLLLPIGGRPLILHTVERANDASTVSRVVVATDDQRIFDAVTQGGFEAWLTSPDHRSGTDRIAEVAASLPQNSVIVNVQGDEPLIDPATIDRAVHALVDNPQADISTAYEPIGRLADLLNGNVVKVVVGDHGYALHFSRSPMPFPRDASLRYGGDANKALINEPELLSLFKKHTGLYVYRRDYLLKLSKLPQTRLERLEMLEQLRALEDGAKIRAVEAAGVSIGVDTKEDYDEVRGIIESRNVTLRYATRDDICQIAAVHVDSWQRSFRNIAPDAYLNEMSVAKREKVFAERLAEPTYRLIVADAAGRGIVGFIDFGTPNIENYGYQARVYSFYLLPEFQRRGLGRRLFEKCFQEMTEHGFRSACLDTLEMSPYRGFYEKHGGKIVAHDIHKLGDEEFATVIYGWESLA